jgi:predicted HicB family RNase H-like nuclease
VTRIYYDLDEELHRRAKLAAVGRGVSLKAWLIEAITEKLEREEPGRHRKR